MMWLQTDKLSRRLPKRIDSATRSTKGLKVLILSVSAGTGHIRAAEALEKVFRERPEVGEVYNVDALQFTNRLFRDFYSKFYVFLIQKAPALFGVVYDKTSEPWKTDRMRIMLDRLNTGPLERFVADFQPDITVCTHFLPAEIISHLISEKKLDARLSIVTTDLDLHAMWLCRTFHRYFVAIEEGKAYLMNLGMPSESITVSGIPIDPVFSIKKDKVQLRLESGLDPERPLLLISGGALGVSPVSGVLEALTRLRTPIQAIVVCGKNSELRSQLELQSQEIQSAHPHLKFRVLGYTNAMHEWMQMADLFIGKPGGLTTAEAMASGVPMVIVAPIPGLEDRNSDHLLEEGVAIKCNDFITMAYKLDQLLENPDRIATMRAKAVAYGRPNAATTIVETLLSERSFAPVKVGPPEI